ncbi:polysaccharide pyruvyl transferase family protein [Exiguobacterium sp. SH5S13]|uniref:polysaccharide pyruvyl transferase family protein n=1 Tax=Exiguobacterium sp. SH5S13 TaxID=2510959 RepID=UPI00103C8703|nr:polysaccharide pyruvyl transferase family protein [Exiguobacterium sp. SH5S13]TCI49905.1 polysaccharide pyruvyl transferase family protein [Exiguobacterium sp. SH5S13]
MKKVGIATVHTGYNYGSSLQAYASKIILKELGYDGVNISLKGSIVKGRDVRIKKLAVIIFRLLKQPFNIRKRMRVYSDNMSKPYSEESKALFDKFRLEKIQPCEYTWSQIKREANSNDFKAFLCGSDQIWNAEALYVDPQYYLRFAPKEKRIAFAPSFGRNEIADYNKKIIAKYIIDIPYISVREESGVNIIKKLTNQDAVHLIDPTLVLDGNQWDKYLEFQKSKELSNKNYILAYFLNEPSSYAMKCMKKLAQDKKMEIIALPFRKEGADWMDTAPNAGPVEFVQYIKNASYVCTDSFHGTAFAVNYKVPFYTFERQYGSAGKQSSRLISFLNLVSLDKHFNPTIDFLNKPVDFSNSSIVLESEREKSLDYLRKTLK